MPLYAGDVKIQPDLAGVFRGIGTKANQAIGGIYGGAKNRLNADAVARGQPRIGDYGTGRLGTQEALDTGNLESSLGGQLGEGSYTEAKNLRDYGQQSQLAEEIGNAMRPSTLEQIFKGIGSAGQLAGMGYGLYNSRSKGNPTGDLPPDLSLYRPGSQGYRYYMGG